MARSDRFHTTAACRDDALFLLAHVYYAARDDDIPAKKAGTLIYALVQLAKVIEVGAKDANAHELPRCGIMVMTGNHRIRNGVIVDDEDLILNDDEAKAFEGAMSKRV